MLIVSAIDSIRTLPTNAFFGSSLFFFFFLSTVLFLLPVAFISAEFSSRFPDKGGVFYWVLHAFGERAGVLTVWLQWINTMVWYPTMLLFIAGTFAYLIDSDLAQNKMFLLLTSLTIFWSLTLLNLNGIKISARVNSICGSIGTIFPMIFLILLGLGWALSGNPIAISWDFGFSSFDFFDSSLVLVSIMASFLGMELAGVHVSDIENPQKNFPKAVAYSVLILLSTLLFGSLSIAAVIPKQEIQFVGGIMQTFTTFFNVFHLSFLIPVLALLIVIGSAGGSVNWLLSPAKGLLQAAEHGFLPGYFSVKNRHGVPVRILIAQAILVSILCFAIQLVPSINSYYWVLMAVSTSLYMLMYMLMFAAALKLKRDPSAGYQIPKGLRTFSIFSGLTGCSITIFVGLLPSPDVVVESKLKYAFMVASGLIFLIAPVGLLWRYKKAAKPQRATL
jgi:amino acid transporter